MTSTATTRPGANSPLGAPAAEPVQPGRSWTIATTAGYAATGYLPAWAVADPSETGISLDLLPIRLADVNHCTVFEGQTMRVRSPGCGCVPGRLGETEVLRGSIDCNPYAEDPEPSDPVVNIATIEDFWINGLDSDGLAEIAAKLRAKADRLDREIRPRLLAARADWTAHHAT
ncbi:hypothetical protein GA0115240_142317 [Streptomyces sp. DvalAA-14]|uniref:DUF6907 domain-containing protein n=1 Tax=unclassified Streptomyces TaxID=2593676 RepID=UPI00081B8248|nr:MULTISPECIES: hypothetical protein [unclassified Streptomyces]MYS22580.1 hypothetical protein [Streptomyces sp. SID4948]SCE18714.1 hypothetical protein GA0115240_142317 [Streptomyces sp. DvalAA-14]